MPSRRTALGATLRERARLAAYEPAILVGDGKHAVCSGPFAPPMLDAARDTILTVAKSARPIVERLARGTFASEHDVGAALEALCNANLLDLPAPGSGRTREHHAALVELGAIDLSLARLAEGHSDALTILQEIAGTEARATAARRGPYGVWAAEPPGTQLSALRIGHGYRLSGTKRYASGARVIARALVTVKVEDGQRLFDVDLRAPGIRATEGSWAAVGMADSGSLDVVFDDVAVPLEAAIGAPNAYVQRPGFEHGGVRVAACWLGGAVGAVRMLAARLGAKRAVDGHDLASLGVLVSTCRSMKEVLDAAAVAIDEDPTDVGNTAVSRALHVRRTVEQGCQEVLLECGRASGSSPLVFDHAHARRVADLAVYLRQHHGRRDLERLGRLLLEETRCSP